MTENELSKIIIGCAIDVHKILGPGLLESVYEKALVYELIGKGLSVLSQVPIPVIYKEKKLDIGYRVDVLVENKVIVEIKSIENLAPILFSQTLTYIKLSNIKLGLLINFNTIILKEGIQRIVNSL